MMWVRPIGQGGASDGGREEPALAAQTSSNNQVRRERYDTQDRLQKQSRIIRQSPVEFFLDRSGRRICCAFHDFWLGLTDPEPEHP